jgi:phenylalanine-4-hydroxylase
MYGSLRGLFAPRPLVGVAFELAHSPGSLWTALEVFKNHGVQLTHVENRAAPFPPHKQTFYVHFEGALDDPQTLRCLRALAERAAGPLYKVPAPTVPWFPRTAGDLDVFGKSTLDAGDQLQADHPGFSDPVYRTRRTEIAAIAKTYVHGSKIPEVKYSKEEVETWRTIFLRLTGLYPRLACKEHQEAVKELIDQKILGEEKIPQLQELSEYVGKKTGFTFRPVTGLLSARDFLNALAFRVFFSTQYIRHHSRPWYTPEPDIVHELLGHAPMFLNKDFADFTQYIGLASLGASDEDIKRLATCYWFSVEFGLIHEPDGMKAYGAGLLSSFGELEHATSPSNTDIEIRPWEPLLAADQPYPITSMQPVYFAANSIAEAKERMKHFCDNQIQKPFNCIFDNNTVFTDIDVRTKPLGMKYTPLLNRFEPLILA